MKKKTKKYSNEFYRIQDEALDDLRQYRKKWNRFNFKDDKNESLPFFIQLRMSMFELLSKECIHTFKDMVIHTMNEVIKYEQDRISDTDDEVMSVNTKH